MSSCHWTRTFRLCVLAGVLSAACSGGGKTATDAAATALTCQAIRHCVWASCSTDIAQPCVNDCAAKGTAEGQAAFQRVAACTVPHCPTGDLYCGCEQRCFADGNCLTETEACVAGNLDLICEQLCRSGTATDVTGS